MMGKCQCVHAQPRWQRVVGGWGRGQGEGISWPLNRRTNCSTWFGTADSTSRLVSPAGHLHQPGDTGDNSEVASAFRGLGPGVMGFS